MREVISGQLLMFASLAGRPSSYTHQRHLTRDTPALIDLDRFIQLFERLGAYPVWEIFVEFAIIWLVVYAIARFLQGTRAAGAIKGLLVVFVIGTLVVRILGTGGESFQRVAYLYDRVVALVAVALIVIFQPELRRLLIRLGEAPLFRSSTSSVDAVIDSVVSASAYLAKTRFGALIVIERHLGLRGLTEGGTTVDAEVSDRLLRSIFFPGSALHDLAVVIKGNRVRSAGVQLPLAEPGEMPDPNLGSRHRAAVGLTKESDALVVVVSEETGAIRLAERGRLGRPLTPDELGDALRDRLGKSKKLVAEPAEPMEPIPDPADEGEGEMLAKKEGAA